jgi:hypothetical protein
METKQFHIGDLVSVTDGHLISTQGILGVESLLVFMRGGSLPFSLKKHPLIVAADECAPHLLRQFPWLKEIVLTDDVANNAQETLKSLELQWGAFHMVSPITGNDHD